MMICEICERTILVSTPGCHTTGACPKHGLMVVIYPSSGKCAHAKILDDKALADRLYEMAVA